VRTDIEKEDLTVSYFGSRESEKKREKGREETKRRRRWQLIQRSADEVRRATKVTLF
jgi:hypothetical protein